MKMSKEQNIERELPSGYKQALYINAKNARFGIIFNLIALIVCAIVMATAAFSLHIGDKLSVDILEIDFPQFIVAYLILFAALIGYVVLHELVHGIAYKTLTGEKLTFGISWSCAFCGVPQIYTYRRTALIAVLAPFVLFSLLFLAIAAVLLFLSPLWYMLTVLLFAIHVGGCCGDLFVAGLLLFKYRSPKTLMRDTGPEQFFYLSE